jgi:hypothetical protein
MKTIYLVAALFALSAAAPRAAQAKELHFDCARANQTVMVDIDTDRKFLQLMWGQGVAEEYKDGDFYISSPDDKTGRTQKVVYTMKVEEKAIIFGQDRLCVEDPAKGRCLEHHLRNSLDLVSSVLKYDDGDEIAVLKCTPAPPGRGF